MSKRGERPCALGALITKGTRRWQSANRKKTPGSANLFAKADCPLMVWSSQSWRPAKRKPKKERQRASGATMPSIQQVKHDAERSDCPLNWAIFYLTNPTPKSRF